MTIIDLVVLGVGALAAWTGWRVGGVHTLVGLAGRVAGLAAGLWVAHLVAGSTWAFAWRVGAEIAVVLLGGVIGGRLAAALAPTPVQPSAPDRVLGAVVRGAVGIAVAAAVVAGLALWGPAAAAGATAGSLTASAATPRVSAVANDLRESLPADLDGIVPAAGATPDGQGTVLTAAEAAATVQVVAGSPGSTYRSVGSGFVVDGARVVTAHHVVSGRSTITVVASGRQFDASVAVDDASGDISVLSVRGLDTAPVTVSRARVAPGTAVVVAGYPGGGPLQAGAGEVVGGIALPVAGGSGVALRPAYRLAADVRPGNSGGPVFDATGEVVAMVDARSLTQAGVGFAITAEPVLAALAA